jgi:hypothetical protein
VKRWRKEGKGKEDLRRIDEHKVVEFRKKEKEKFRRIDEEKVRGYFRRIEEKEQGYFRRIADTKELQEDSKRIDAWQEDSRRVNDRKVWDIIRTDDRKGRVHSRRVNDRKVQDVIRTDKRKSWTHLDRISPRKESLERIDGLGSVRSHGRRLDLSGGKHSRTHSMR